MIYLFLADGFEITEALAPVDILRRAKLEIKTVSIKDTLEVTSSCKVQVRADMLLSDISDISDIDCIILPGGMPGTLNLKACKKLEDILVYQYENNKLLCAICAAPSIFGELGFLKGKDATCYPGFEDSMYFANVLSDKVVKSDNIITAKGAGASLEFGYKIVETLISKEKADEIFSSMQY